MLRPVDRRAGQCLAELLKASALFGERTAFRMRATEDSFEDFTASNESVRQIFEELDRAGYLEMGFPAMFATTTDDPLLTLTFERQTLGSLRPHDRARISFNLDKPLVGNGGIFSFAELMKYVGVCVDAFDASSGAIYDSRLQELVSSVYLREKAKRESPPELYEDWPTPAIQEFTPRELARRLSHYADPASFDVAKIPTAVFWINYWNRTLVESVGEDRVRSAPWNLIVDHPRGGLLLATQREEFDALNEEHLERIARVADVLDLYTLQTGKRKR
jgi:hypothetical protein